MNSAPFILQRLANPATSSSAQLDVTNSTTANHLLRVPTLLASHSPPLAAIHLAAARLLLQLPPGAVIDWCHVCGGLRDGAGGAFRKQEQAGGSGSDVKEVKAHPRKRRKPNGKPLANPGARRRPAKCTICNAPYRRPKPDPATLAAFPSARRSARTRRTTSAAAAAAEVGIGTRTKAVDGTASVSGSHSVPNPLLSTTVASILSAVSAPQTTSSRNDPVLGTATTIPPTASTVPVGQQQQHQSPAPSSGYAGHPKRPNPLMARPSLSHIPGSEPDPPTYPMPEPVLAVKAKLGLSPSPSAAAASSGRKKKKTSGLAKLLAERKEREEGEKQGAGRWGLD